MKPAHRLPSDPPRRLQTPWCEKAEICLAKNRKCREDDQYAFYYGGKIFSLVVTIGMLIVSGFELQRIASNATTAVATLTMLSMASERRATLPVR
jgi:hypothetical protein